VGLVTPARPDIELRNRPLEPFELLSHSQQEGGLGLAGISLRSAAALFGFHVR
jgi:hypothetical protein